MKLCDWSDFEENVAELIKRIERNEKASIGFYVIPVITSPAIHRKAAEIWINDKHPFNGSLGNILKIQHQTRYELLIFRLIFAFMPYPFYWLNCLNYMIKIGLK